ncbi:MAG: ABC transporter ATP-binding protein [Desulfurococcales archaeon]|nr:ABC transporter ATP-binding protein [Desulfurococcales archaeon]
MKIVEVEGLVKSLKGKPVLRGVSMSVDKGSIYVLAGPNGAGKTTTIRIILGLIKRDGGRVKVLGVDPEGDGWDKARRRIGYLPEDAGVYDRLTGFENLWFNALLFAGGDEILAREYMDRGIDISGLSREQLSKRAGSYSKGMKRRLLLASALMHSPELVVMDEPTSGLDVIAAYRIKSLIREMAARGTSFLITTHDMLEAEQLADKVAFIMNGATVAEAPPRELMEKYGSESLEEAFVKAVGGVEA